MDEREKKGIVRPDMINLLMQAKKGGLKHEGDADESSGFATVTESAITKSPTHKRGKWVHILIQFKNVYNLT